MSALEPLLITVTAVTAVSTCANLLATLYRIKIERDQIKLLVEQAKRKEVLGIFRKHIKLEKDEILNMTKEDLKCFLDELEHLGEEE